MDRPPEEKATPAPLLSASHLREVAAYRRTALPPLANVVQITADEADALADALDERDRLLGWVKQVRSLCAQYVYEEGLPSQEMEAVCALMLSTEVAAALGTPDENLAADNAHLEAHDG